MIFCCLSRSRLSRIIACVGWKVEYKLFLTPPKSDLLSMPYMKATPHTAHHKCWRLVYAAGISSGGTWDMIMHIGNLSEHAQPKPACISCASGHWPVVHMAICKAHTGMAPHIWQHTNGCSHAVHGNVSSFEIKRVTCRCSHACVFPHSQLD